MALSIINAVEDAAGIVHATATEPATVQDASGQAVAGVAAYPVSTSAFQADGVTRKTALALIVELKLLAAALRRAAATSRADLLG